MTYTYITIPDAFITRKGTLRERIRAKMARILATAEPSAWTIGAVRYERGAWEVCVGIGGGGDGLPWLEGYFADHVRAMTA
jgi:hypothetical protein